jgi:2,4-dienoyl-CoA reductase-like NADH-dependent reductase (Old Yellow Enzyme family)
MEDKKKTGVTRRDFIKGTAVGAAALAATGVLSACATPGAAGAAGRRQSPIFEPTRIGNLTVKNKIFRAAMAERRHDANGNPTSSSLRMWEEEATGGAGMIITGGISCLREDATGTIFPHFSEASQIPSYRGAADVVHRNGAKICAQLMIVGAPGSPFFVERITREDIRRGIAAFAQTAVWVRDAGYDAVNFHFAHRYLLSQLISNHFNTRTDEYGGSVENRARLAFEAVEAVRRAVGRSIPLSAKIDADDHRMGAGARDHLGRAMPSGKLSDAHFIVQGLADRGVDAIEISGGVTRRSMGKDILPKEDHNFFAKDARAIAGGTNVPLMLTGGVRSIERMEETLRYNNKIIAFGMARTLLSEPDLPNKWRQNINQEPRCLSCDWCLDNLFVTERALCILNQNRA